MLPLYLRWICVESGGYPASQLPAGYACNADDLSCYRQPGNLPGSAIDFSGLCPGWAFSTLQNLRANPGCCFHLKNQIRLLMHLFCLLQKWLPWLSYQGAFRFAAQFSRSTRKRLPLESDKSKEASVLAELLPVISQAQAFWVTARCEPAKRLPALSMSCFHILVNIQGDNQP